MSTKYLLLLLICIFIPMKLFAQEYTADANTVALYHLNETSGSAVSDASSNGNNGAATGTSIVDGKFGKARSFNGVNDYISLPSSTSLTNFSNAITIEAWIKLNSYGLQGGIILASGNENEYSIAIHSNGKIGITMVMVNPQINHEFISKSSLSLDLWYHVAFTYNGTEENIYINGMVDTSYTTSGNISTTQYSEYISIGCYRFNGNPYSSFFNGIIDEVRVSNKAREPWEFSIMGVPCPGTPTVDYAGKIYNTVQIGTQCWLKENLDVGTRIDGTQPQADNSTIEKYCYNNDTNNCNTYGGLYKWNEAMQYSTTPSTQGICPPGWHIPTSEEFQTLNTAVGGDGNALKAIGQGTGDGAGTNACGFSALLAGVGLSDGGSNYLGANTLFWGSTEAYPGYAHYMNLNDYNSVINVGSYYNYYGFSVRCVKDESPLPIQLGSFIVIPNPVGNGVKLEWQTISEINNYGFYIERKFNIGQNFTDIPNSFIAGHGTTIEMQEYSFVDNTLTIPGTYHYRLRQVDNDGLVHYSHVVSINTSSLTVNEIAPIEFRVHQNYPNPTNPKTTIRFSVDKVEHATVIIYDVLGKEVAKLFDGITQPGRYYSIEFDGSSLSSGIYFYKVSTESHSEMRKLVLLK